MRRIGFYAVLHFLRLALAFLTAGLVSRPLIAMAARERGFEGAFGGEWILIIGVFVLTYYIAAKKIRPP